MDKYIGIENIDKDCFEIKFEKPSQKYAGGRYEIEKIGFILNKEDMVRLYNDLLQ